MSTVLAIIYNGEICLASDTMSTDHETGEELEPSTKQIVINNEIAIGFAGSGNIAETIMKTLASKRNEHIVSKLTLSEIPKVLDEIYQAHIANRQYPDEETRHVSALIIGTDNHIPKIFHWESNGTTVPIYSDGSPAVVLPPYDLTTEECLDAVKTSIKKNAQNPSLKKIVTDYFNIIASKSKFTSATATIWVQTFNPRKGQIVWNWDILDD